jgi:hypothetical protein
LRIVRVKRPLKESIARASETLVALVESLVALRSEKAPRLKALLEDAVAKRYEVAFEALWKLFKLAAQEQGTEAPGPKPAISAALRYGWIEKSPQMWQAFLEARNSGVHEYFSLPKREYFGLVKQFAEAARTAVKRLDNDLKRGIG